MTLPDSDGDHSVDDFSDKAATFGDRVAAARGARNYSQAQLARRLGIKVQTLQNWEEDRSEPRANKLQMLAGVLNVSIIWLMSGVGEGFVPSDEGHAASVPENDALLEEVRAIRDAQLALHARLGRLEKRLRGMA
ncbi:MAG: helix-turn-helix transcriptional regulator [Pseudomonadota bacterium]